jgi:hypothetical protein
VPNAVRPNIGARVIQTTVTRARLSTALLVELNTSENVLA